MDIRYCPREPLLHIGLQSLVVRKFAHFGPLRRFLGFSLGNGGTILQRATTGRRVTTQFA